MHARDILSRPVVTVRPETPLTEAIGLLTEHGFAALPVVDERFRVIGLLSESDALAAKSAAQSAVVEAVMAVPVQVVHPGTDIATVATEMLAGRLRSMPVVEAGILVGIVSRRDLLRTLINDDATIEAKIRALLDDYAGSRKEWTIDVASGRVTIRGNRIDPTEERVITTLARTVSGVDHVKVLD
ncbi:HPP family protein [Nocardia sp. NBC_01009]|uniref:CBS domain-containing protein n=1 Tax=Nocardia sp. NBC_01009 TaxID=2975996 RepID=UPI003868A776|nr:CBS domain-containing protein [Nocardia sp. NBC_01009]